MKNEREMMATYTACKFTQSYDTYCRNRDEKMTTWASKRLNMDPAMF
jgi:hypothetical protein